MRSLKFYSLQSRCRPTLKREETIYLATMEDNGVFDFTNPRLRELMVFENLFETEKRDYRMNQTAPNADEPNPEYSAYLHWIDDGNPATREDIIGPAIALKVEAGDTLRLEVYAKFEKKVSFARNATVAMMSNILGASFLNPSLGIESFAQAASVFNGNLPAVIANSGDAGDTRPHAYLNYILFDRSYAMINAGAVRVPEGAGFNPGLEITVAPQLTQFQNAITTHQAGYVYVWVSNESENTKVWFDDLKVTHRSSRVTQATDYYAWGNVMRENKSPEDVRYRYGYQGQFAEKDEETGWNHFELREYDAVIGRWLVVDPKKQYYSPYLSMGNNPLLRVDPDGGDDWIPQVDKNGKTSYVAEAGDNFDTFVQQFNVSEFDALEYFANSGYSGLEGPFSLSSIKEGTRIDAPFLQLNLKMTDGGWFKSDSWSKKMQQQAINHVAFAFEHAKRNGMSEFSVGKIFNFNKMDFSGGTGINFSGTMNMGGVNVPVRVEMVIMWNSTISIHPTPKPVHDDQMINYNFFHPGKGNPDYKGYIQVPAKYESQAHSFFFNK